jgi:hypothetical protein
MQTSLFDNPSLLQQSSTKSYTISEEKIIQPLTQILEEITPKPTTQTVKPKNNTQSIKQSLDQLFPEQQYDEKSLRKQRKYWARLQINLQICNCIAPPLKCNTLLKAGWIILNGKFLEA